MPKRVDRPVRGALRYIVTKDTVELCQLHALPYRDPSKYPDPWAGDVLAGRGPLIELVMKYASASDIEKAMAHKKRFEPASPQSLQLLQRQINSKYGH